MEKEIDELREGYYYLLLIIGNKSEVNFQVKYIFKHAFFMFYIAALELFIGLGQKYNLFNFPLFLQRNLIILVAILTILIFGIYKLIVDTIFKTVSQTEVNTNLDKALQKPRIIKFLLYFFSSLISMFAVMALFIYKIL